MAKSTRSKEETTKYLSDKDNMKAFIIGLHEYLNKHIKCTLTETEKGERQLNCDFDCNLDRDIQLKHFIDFCDKKRLEWEAVDDMFRRIPNRHWYLCDGVYLYSLKIDNYRNAYYVKVNSHIYF